MKPELLSRKQVSRPATAPAGITRMSEAWPEPRPDRHHQALSLHGGWEVARYLARSRPACRSHARGEQQDREHQKRGHGGLHRGVRGRREERCGLRDSISHAAEIGPCQSHDHSSNHRARALGDDIGGDVVVATGPAEPPANVLRSRV